MADYPQNILVFNCGSSSIKFTVISPDNGAQEVTGMVESLTTGSPCISLKYKENKLLDKQKLSEDSYDNAIKTIINELNKITGCITGIVAIGHRVVHGGEYFSDSVAITEEVKAKIKACIELAPLHNPANLKGIEIAQQEFSQLLHVACFDTAFHQTMPERAYVYPVPYSWYKEHKVRRYGFHGTSHKYVSAEAAKFLDLDLNNSKLITAHLGNGCSTAAVLNGQSVDTSMGLTPLEGLMMGTRSGNIDSSIIFYIAKKLHISAEEAFNTLNKKSGLLGVSGLSMDLRVLEQEAAHGNKRAQLAVELFCYSLAKNIASQIIPLGGLDALVFTAGIGENSSIIRQKTCDLLRVFNVNLDNAKNCKLTRGSAGNIALDNSVPVLVIPTNEELMIAQKTRDLIRNNE